MSSINLTAKTKAELWGLYKSLITTAAQRGGTAIQDLAYRTATKSSLINAIKRIQRGNISNLLNTNLMARTARRQKFNQLRDYARINIIPVLTRAISLKYTIIPHIIILQQRYNTNGTIETIQTLTNPIISYKGHLSKNENSRKEQIHGLINAFLDNLETASARLRIINEGVVYSNDNSPDGIVKNPIFQTLQPTATYTLKQNANDETALIETNDLILRDTDSPNYYSLGIDETGIQTVEGECILNDIIHRYQGEDRNKNMTRSSVLSEMNIIDSDRNKITVGHIKKWALLKDISLYLIGVCNMPLHKSITINMHNKPLFIKVANDHAYMIDDPELQQQIIKNTFNNIKTFIDWKTANIETSAGDINDIYNKLFTLKKYLCLEIKQGGATSETDNVFIITDISYKEDTPLHTLNELAVLIKDRENLAVENLVLDNHGNITGFSYHNIYVIFNVKYYKIRQILDEVVKIPSITNKNMFMFRNQAIQTITRDILEQHNGKIPQSNLNKQTYDLLSRFIKGGYNKNVDMMITRSKTQTLDIEKCHTSILFNRRHEWGVFTPFDEFKPYRGSLVNGAKYTVLKPIHLLITYKDKYGETVIKSDISLPPGIYDSEFIDNCISEGFLKHADINQELIPSKTLPAGFFKEIITLLYQLIPASNVAAPENNNFPAKDLINLFIGSLGSHKHTHNIGEISTSETHNTVWTNQNKDDKLIYKSKVINMGKSCPLYMLFKIDETERIESNLPIYQAVIDMSYWALFQLSKAVVGEHSEIKKFHTDSITVENPIMKAVGNQLFDSNTLPIGHIRVDRLDEDFLIDKPIQKTKKEIYNDELFSDDEYEEDKHVAQRKKQPSLKSNKINIPAPVVLPEILNRKWVERKYPDIEDLITRNKGFGLFGMPGRGKTHSSKAIKDIIESQNKTVISTSLSHKAVENLRNHKLEGMVIRALFSKRPEQTEAGRLIEIAKTYNYILVDEYTINGQDDMNNFYKLFKLGVKIVFIGDYHQLAPIDTHRKLNYRNCLFFKEICCFNYIELTKNYRFDDELDDLITEVYDNGIFELKRSLPDEATDVDESPEINSKEYDDFIEATPDFDYYEDINQFVPEYDNFIEPDFDYYEDIKLKYEKDINKRPDGDMYKNCRFNISYSNATRKQVNKRFSNKNNETALEDDKININGWWCIKGTPIICKFNKVSEGLFNNKMFSLEAWDDTTISLKDDNGDIVVVSKETAIKKTKQGDYNLEIGHCITCHSAQGSTLKGDVCIWDTDHPRISREYLYTALSRATALKHIFIHNYMKIEDLKHEEYDETGGEPITYNRKKAFIGSVYELINKENNEPFYIGSTEKDLEDRYKEHLQASNPVKTGSVINDLYTYIRGDGHIIKFKIKLIETVSYDDIKDLRNREYKIIQQYLQNGETIYNYMGITRPKTKRLKEGTITKKEELKLKGVIYNKPNDNRLVFQYYIKGKRKEKNVKYGKRKTKAQARKELEEFQKSIYL